MAGAPRVRGRLHLLERDVFIWFTVEVLSAHFYRSLRIQFKSDY
jgi:hypothetical protein